MKGPADDNPAADPVQSSKGPFGAMRDARRSLGMTVGGSGRVAQGPPPHPHQSGGSKPRTFGSRSRAPLRMAADHLRPYLNRAYGLRYKEIS